MKKNYTAALLILVFSSVAFCQMSGQQPLIRIDSLPVVDSVPKERQPAQKKEHSFLKDIGLEKPQSVNRREGEPSERFWVSGEFLLWKMRGSDLPPLITVGPDISFLATIGQPGTVIVFGGSKLDQGVFSGGRLTAGFWLNKRKTVGAEVSYFFLEKKTYRFQVSSSGLLGSQAISRPYINLGGSEAPFIVARPAMFEGDSVLAGTSTATFSNRLQGAEANMFYRLSIMQCCRTTLITGFRYLDLNESLTLADVRDFRLFATSVGSPSTATDQFTTRNRFYGGQAGLRSTLSRRRLSLELSGILALGSNRETVNIGGNASIAERFLPFGLLAFTSNIGSYGRNQFTFIPEVRANLGFDLTRSIRPFIGYQFLYWDKVVRPGEQIDRVRDNALTGGTRPAFSFRDSRFWAQGLTTGVKVSF